ncbi:MAG: O-antigen ligase family protein [Vampirovibrionales bacterium]|nr:O-antigen ligase family protein [Vampirovibrionales bacterium]
MSALRAALKNSWALGGLTRLATLPASTLTAWAQLSRLGQWTLGLCEALDPGIDVRAVHPLIRRACQPAVLFTGVCLLFVVAAFQDTARIGMVVWLLFFMSLMASLIPGRPLLRRITMIDALVGLFYLSAVVSTAASSFFLTSLMGLFKMTTFLAAYLLFRNALEAERLTWWVALLWLLALLGGWETLVGWHQYTANLEPLATWQDPDTNPELVMTRVFGTLQPSNPNLLAGYLVTCLSAAFGLGFYHWRGLRRESLLSALAFLLGGGILATLVLTGSRGGYLALAGMFPLAFLLGGHLLFHEPALSARRGLKTLWLSILALGLGSVALALTFSESLRHRLLSIFAMREDSSISYRLNVYDSAMQMARDNWLLGIGPGNDTFKLVYGLYMVPGYTALGAYSVPLEIAVEQGLPGLLIFGALLLALALRTLWFLDSARDIREKILAITLLTAVAGSALYGAFDTIWYRPAVNIAFWLCVAGLAALTENALGREAAKRDAASR